MKLHFVRAKNDLICDMTLFATCSFSLLNQDFLTFFPPSYTNILSHGDLIFCIINYIRCPCLITLKECVYKPLFPHSLCDWWATSFFLLPFCHVRRENKRNQCKNWMKSSISRYFTVNSGWFDPKNDLISGFSDLISGLFLLQKVLNDLVLRENGLITELFL